MDLFIARQPIFDSQLHVYGYELLYRKTRENRFHAETDGDEASANVIINGFNVLGIDKLTDGKRAFVNFTENLLKKGIATLYPKEVLVVEILESVAPDLEVLEACKSLKENGYQLSLDDFVDDANNTPLLEYADIIKVDFLVAGDKMKESIVQKFANGKTVFLAEKIETNEEFLKAQNYGYTLFQGFFFSKPVIHPVGEISPLKLTQLQILEQLHRQDADFTALSGIVMRDVSLSYKLLRLVNSSAFGLLSKVESVRQALVILGLEELRKWISLIIMRGLAGDKPDELIRISLIRAKMFESLGKMLSWQGSEDSLFLMGLFSCLDVLMDRPLAELLDGISIPESVKVALLLREGVFGFLFTLVLRYEEGNWPEVARYAGMIGMDDREITPTYLEAVAWCHGILEA